MKDDENPRPDHLVASMNVTRLVVAIVSWLVIGAGAAVFLFSVNYVIRNCGR